MCAAFSSPADILGAQLALTLRNIVRKFALDPFPKKSFPQSPTRPHRLSSYSWTSRGKACHRLLLHWKGNRPIVHCNDDTKNANTCTYKRESLPQTTSPNSHWYPVPPIHIAVVYPEPPPPIADAFDAAVESQELAEEAYVWTRGGGSRTGRRRRVMFTVGVRVVGPPRVVLEGRCVVDKGTMTACNSTTKEIASPRRSNGEVDELQLPH